MNSQSNPPNAFSVLIGGSRPVALTVVKDKCPRLEPIYNLNYNLDELPRSDLPKDYSLYVRGEPLYNDRPVIVANLPLKHTVAAPPKRPRTL